MTIGLTAIGLVAASTYVRPAADLVPSMTPERLALLLTVFGPRTLTDPSATTWNRTPAPSSARGHHPACAAGSRCRAPAQPIEHGTEVGVGHHAAGQHLSDAGIPER